MDEFTLIEKYFKKLTYNNPSALNLKLFTHSRGKLTMPLYQAGEKLSLPLHWHTFDSYAHDALLSDVRATLKQLNARDEKLHVIVNALERFLTETQLSRIVSQLTLSDDASAPLAVR